MIDRAVEFAKHHSPNSLRVAARRAQMEARNARMRLTVPVVAKNEFDNVFHCTVRKTGSQWIKALFSDPAVYRHSGLLPYDPRFYAGGVTAPVPAGRTGLAIFLSHKRFEAVPKAGTYRAFFVIRDPRDVVVSSYFSLRNSHAPMGDIPQARKVLQERPKKEGMLHVIERLRDKKQFGQMRSWAVAPPAETFRLFRYEDLTGEGQAEEIDRLLRHCGITLPPAELAALLARYSFTNMKKGKEAPGRVSHYRKGAAGDWRNHFDDEIYAAYTRAAGDLAEVLGYPSRDDAVGAHDGQEPAAR
ncbi:sulfotransferase domain-containing protein [Micromonospora robiginosa]|uniref:Sulfotransferase domain-containing protein n=1 Tax=Micromonospora robiginosa TaxID=2749844 RepID=A0A7L6AZM6_9ACTN|nr:sulfotransferase domain-containing protein [Micromonospora ferruginea]QLQ34945.1 sulfotransferase domain-containing protein [Micromonospora ferruginea]